MILRATLTALLACLLALPAAAQTITERALDGLPCVYCQAFISDGGGRAGATFSLLDLHVISSAADAAFPRALLARIETQCLTCQAAAAQIQARGLAVGGAIFGLSLEAYSAGRATVAEFNIGAADGGYVLDVVPVRMADGSASRIDSVMKIEGQNGDAGAAQIGAIVEVKVNPSRAVIVLPAVDGCVTVIATADGRMHEDWCNAGGVWSRRVIGEATP